MVEGEGGERMWARPYGARHEQDRSHRQLSDWKVITLVPILVQLLHRGLEKMLNTY